MLLKLAAIVGLILNLAGVLILFRFGMPYRVETEGMIVLIDEGQDAEGIRLDAIYRRWGYLGLIFIVLGTALQIASVAMS